MMSPADTACHATRSEIEPSSMASRSCCGVRRRQRPRATLAPGAALRTYQTSLLPLGRPIACANVSFGCTWMERGWLVNSNFSKSEGITAPLPGRSYQISPIALPSWGALLWGRRSSTPQGFGKACAVASSIAITPPDVRTRQLISIAEVRRNLNHELPVRPGHSSGVILVFRSVIY